MNTATASFDTTVRQMTEMFQWPLSLQTKDRNVSVKKNNYLDNHEAFNN